MRIERVAFDQSMQVRAHLPDISPEDLERRIADDTRKAILHEEDEQARITRLLW